MQAKNIYVDSPRNALRPHTPLNPQQHARTSPFSSQNMEVVHPQLWIFDFDARSWSCVEAGDGGGGGSEGGGAGPAPPAVFDHTATRVGNKHIVVIGGAMVGTALNSKVRCDESLDMSSPTTNLCCVSNSGPSVAPAPGSCCGTCTAISFALRLRLVGTKSVYVPGNRLVLVKKQRIILSNIGATSDRSQQNGLRTPLK